jgi:hypothetical protein
MILRPVGMARCIGSWCLEFTARSADNRRMEFLGHVRTRRGTIASEFPPRPSSSSSQAMNPILPPGGFNGYRRRTYRLQGIRLTENSVAPAFVIPRHAHLSASFGMVIQGGYRANYDARSRECTPDTLVFHPAAELHSERHHEVVVRMFRVEPTGQLLGRVPDYCGALDGPREFLAGPLPRPAHAQGRVRVTGGQGSLLEGPAEVCEATVW